MTEPELPFPEPAPADLDDVVRAVRTLVAGMGWTLKHAAIEERGWALTLRLDEAEQ